jgi:uncharacterized membrane protein
VPRGPVLPALRLRASAARYRFRESLFLLPATIVLLGAVTAEGAALLDRTLTGTRSDTAVPGTLTMDSNAATWLLSTVAGATITTAGVVFSLTVVSLQLASSQFSPRVMRSFIRDRLSQVVIGVLVATFVHCVLTLRHVSGDPTAPAPPVGLTVTVALALGTVLLIVAHLDHLARRLQVGEVVRAIAKEGRDVVDGMAHQPDPGVSTSPAPDLRPQSGLVITAPRDGWVTQALSGDLMRYVPPGTVVRLETRTGAYVHAGEPLVVLWPAPARTERAIAAMVHAIGVDDTRTMQQDVDFAIRQLVDIGLRALSPAINDPTTAVEVVLRIGGLLRTLLLRDLPAETAAYPDGRVLLRPWDLSHEEYVDHAFDQLRQAGVTQPQVMATMIRVLRMLLAHVEDSGRPQHVPHLRRHLDVLRECIASGRGIHASDVDRLLVIADAPTDPADHSAPAWPRAAGSPAAGSSAAGSSAAGSPAAG